MSKSEKIREMRLAEIEGEFRSLLVSCLQECGRGRWRLFGQNDHIDPEGRYWVWPEARRLRDLASEIRMLRHEFGQVNDDCERFLQLCSLRGSNVPGVDQENMNDRRHKLTEIINELRNRAVKG
jgi:hypothetical protein